MVAENGSTNGSTNDAYELDNTATTNSSNGSSATSSISASGVAYIDPLLNSSRGICRMGDSELFFYLGDSVVPYTASYADPLEQNVVEIADAQKDELRAAYSTWSTYALLPSRRSQRPSGLVVGDSGTRTSIVSLGTILTASRRSRTTLTAIVSAATPSTWHRRSIHKRQLR